MSGYWPESQMARELPELRRRVELQRWIVEARQKLAALDPPPVFIRWEPPKSE